MNWTQDIDRYIGTHIDIWIHIYLGMYVCIYLPIYMLVFGFNRILWKQTKNKGLN